METYITPQENPAKPDDAEPAKACSTCLYWDPTNIIEDMGECRRLVPQHVDKSGRAQWPITAPGDWCGVWASKDRRTQRGKQDGTSSLMKLLPDILLQILPRGPEDAKKTSMREIVAAVNADHAETLPRWASPWHVGQALGILAHKGLVAREGKKGVPFVRPEGYAVPKVSAAQAAGRGKQLDEDGLDADPMWSILHYMPAFHDPIGMLMSVEDIIREAKINEVCGKSKVYECIKRAAGLGYCRKRSDGNWIATRKGLMASAVTRGLEHFAEKQLPPDPGANNMPDSAPDEPEPDETPDLPAE